MPMPKKLKIGVYDYTVHEVKELTREKAGNSDTEDPQGRLWGQSSQGQLTLHVEQDLPAKVKKVTFLHEVLHGILDQTTYANDSESETICRAMEHLLYDFIANNPKAIAYLQEKN